jgi:hypothetical protein
MDRDTKEDRARGSRDRGEQWARNEKRDGGRDESYNGDAEPEPGIAVADLPQRPQALLEAADLAVKRVYAGFSGHEWASKRA